MQGPGPEEQILAMGWMDRDALKAALQDKPAELSVVDYLVHLGRLTAEQGMALRSSLHVCPSCLKRYEVRGGQEGLRYSCPRCQSALIPDHSAPEPIDAEKIRSTLQALPEDVQTAAQDPDRRIGKYIKVSHIARGGMGSVWKGFDMELRRTVAIKFLEGAGETTVQRFLREAKVTARLEHAGIARVYDSGRWQGQPYIVMQFVEGKAPTAALPLNEVMKLIVQASRAIHFAHEQGIIHRDIKPDNLMVNPQGGVVVLDFGLARDQDVGKSISASGAIMGTPPYMSPEQIRGQTNRIDARSDVYSLGATLYELATDKVPYTGPDLADFMVQIQEVDPIPPRKLRPLPWEVEVIILKAMDKDPSRRYQSAREFADDIERFLGGEPILARPSGVLYRLQKRARRQPAAFASLSLLVLAALLAATFSLGSRMEQRRELRRLLDEGQARLREGDFQKAHELLVRAAAIDGAAAEPLLAQAQKELSKRQQMAEHEEERKQLEPLFQALREVENAGWVRNYSAKTEELLKRAEELTGDRGGVWVARGWAKRLRSMHGGPRRLIEESLADLEKPIAGPYAEEGVFQRGLTLAERVRGRLPELTGKRRGDVMEWTRKGALDPETQGWADRAVRDLSTRADPYGQALIDFLRQKYSDAIQKLERPEAAGTIEAQLLLMQSAYFGLGDAKRIEDAEYLARRTHRPEVVRLAGLMNMTHGSPAKAEQFFTELLELIPEALGHLINRGVCRRRLGKIDEAIADYTRVLESNPNHLMALGNRGHARGDKGDFAGAEADYSKLLSLEPSADTYCDRARARTGQGKYAEAEEDAEQAMRLDGKLAYAWFLRGQARLNLNRPDEAASDFTRSLELRPRFAESHYLRGNAWMAQNQPAEALADYAIVILINPKVGQVLKRIDEAIDRLSGPHAILADLEKSLQTLPKDPAVEKLLEKIRKHR